MFWRLVMRRGGALPARAEQIQPLDAAAVYLTPTGRLCRLWELDGRGGEYPIAKLRYVRAAASAASGWSDGFCLAPQNWRILTRVA